jgi:creatinine amidohydrolase
MVMAERPDLVRESIRVTLEPNPTSLSVAIRDGKKTFEEAGGLSAYFGFPRDATPEEGRETIATLGGILAEALGAAGPQGRGE